MGNFCFKLQCLTCGESLAYLQHNPNYRKLVASVYKKILSILKPPTDSHHYRNYD